MNDTTARHLVCILATLITGFAFYAGYVSGTRGWWWAIFGCLIIYGGVYRIISK